MKKHLPKYSLVVLLILAASMYLYKLNYEYFFTDEIVYTQAGMAMIKGDYSLSTEVPMLGKYIAGITASLANKNIFLLRLPFALMGVVAVVLVYLIVRDQFGHSWGILGSILYLFSPFIFFSTRMVMLEPLLHMMWLLFHYCFFKFLTLRKNSYLICSGVFLGLAMASKIPSLLIYPFSLVISCMYFYSQKEKIDLTKIKQLLYIYIISGIVYSLFYIGLFLKDGISGLIKVPQSVYDKYYVDRDQAGKPKVIGDTVYIHSPAWFYLFYMKEKYFPLHLILAICAPFISAIKTSFFSMYWLIYFIFCIIFFQILGVKEARYVASFELPLVFLMIVSLRTLLFIIKRYFGNTLVYVFIFTLGVSVVLPRFYDLYLMQPTKYNALKNLLVKETDNFKTGDRTVIYGSIRSGRWTFEDYPYKPVITRKDFEIRCDYQTFKYIVFDKIELIKSEKNELFDYIKANEDFYDFRDISGLLIFTKKENTYPKVDSCCFLKPGMGFN